MLIHCFYMSQAVLSKTGWDTGRLTTFLVYDVITEAPDEQHVGADVIQMCMSITTLSK